MQLKTGKHTVVFLALVVLAVLVISLTTIQREPTPSLGPDAGSARLISVQDLPDMGDMCFPESAGSVKSDEPGNDNLFDAFGETSAYAAETGDTVDITRPPVRTIRDT